MASSIQSLPANQSGQRHFGIDVLRGIAVLLVLGRHMTPPAACPRWAQPFIVPWYLGGWVGVDLFFVLSGFLVSGLLFQDYLRHGRFHIGRFYVRRGFKIYPAFYLMLLVSLLIGPSLTRRAFPYAGAFHEALFVQNYLGGVWNHTWSLAVEEHFYLALPLLLSVMVWISSEGSPRFNRIVPLTVIIALTLTVCRIWRAGQIDNYVFDNLMPTHLRIDSLMAGVLISFFATFRREAFESWITRHSLKLGCCGVVCLAPAFFFVVERSPWLTTWGLTLFYMGGACLLCCVIGRPPNRTGIMRTLAAIGYYSYSIYLWHMPVKVWFVPLLRRQLGWRSDYLLDTGLYLALSIALGIALAKLIEIPVLRFRDSCFPSPARAEIRVPSTSNPVPVPAASI